ncbi:hypothetical protein DL764_006420 [Monosporascus ibericus]|uniref:Uncharacterized protein n=1 Tax=Monosporascus ibericus TaxID=155417 RepID=A0A4Q4T785_9PEZI|nr:hypothetical protein DL764_006420 [Monosporascus ibericus]
MSSLPTQQKCRYIPQVVIKSWQMLTVEQSKLDVGLAVVLKLPLLVVGPVGAAVRLPVLGVAEGEDGGRMVGSPGVGLHGVFLLVPVDVLVVARVAVEAVQLGGFGRSSGLHAS